MNDDEIARRKGLTFAQAEGAEPLPAQLKRTEISRQLRAALWAYIYGELQDTAERDTWTYVGDPWRTVLKNVHVYLFHQPADEFDTRFKDAAEAVKAVFMQGDYVHQQGTVDRSAQIKRGTEARGLHDSRKPAHASGFRGLIWAG